MTTECTKPRITLKTLAIATEQEVFDQVVQHLREQGVQSKNENGCAYRGDDGLMCAAGCLIADDEYESFVKKHDSDTNWNSLVEMSVVPSNHEGLIKELQDVHDCSDLTTWEPGFKGIASDYNLVYTN